MKKKIAVFANGWSKENVHQFVVGINRSIPAVYADTFIFLSYAVYGMAEDVKNSELSIFSLPDMHDFDGAIILGASVNYPESLETLCERIREAGIPGVIMGIEKEGLHFVGADNYTGMKELCDHIIEEHGAKKIKYIAGSRDNADSNMRLVAVRDSIEEHNLTISDDDILYSDWDPRRAADYASHSLKGDNKPDAIICANDMLAMFVCFGLEDNGYYVPDDVLVTGFDFQKESQDFYPSIASVDQHFETMGYACAKILIDYWHGVNNLRHEIIPCQFLEGESCSCFDSRNDSQRRKDLARRIPKDRIYEENKQGRLRAFEGSILKSDKYSNLAKNIQDLIYASNGREGKTFFFMMDPKFGELAYDSGESFPKYTYCKNMDVMAAKVDGVPVPADFSNDNLIPGYIGEGLNRTYVFLPVYNGAFCCGYLVFGDNLEYVEDLYFQRFQSNTIQVLDRYKQQLQLNALNEKLQDLMQTDALTSVKNRTAFENQKAQMEEAMEKGTQDLFAVCMFDVNNLKKINDEKGHEAGDAYIRNACKLICECFKHSPVYRVGGDEFVVFIMNNDFHIRNELMQGFKERMALLMATELPEVNRVSIASGMASYDPMFDKTINDVFTRADAEMYENKYKMKNGNVR